MKNPLRRKPKVEDKSAPAPNRKAMHGKVAALLKAFGKDPPAEANVDHGRYRFNARDRWHGRKIGAYDGWYGDGAWSVRIQGGCPVEIVRADHPAQPARAIKVNG